MIQIQQLKLPIEHTNDDLYQKAAKTLRISPEQILELSIKKQSIDARKKEQLSYVYTLYVKTEREEQILKRIHHKDVSICHPKEYEFVVSGKENLPNRPVIAGFGPAGIFCAYVLAKAGYQPLVIERGKCVEQRKKDVSDFWSKGSLNTESNVLFGEGGAGAFSDGKLNTLVKDPLGRNQKVLETFVLHGAPKEILYEAKPHIGTDVLEKVIPSMRQEIIRNGGEIWFETAVTDVKIKNNTICELELNHDRKISCTVFVLAIGHSARDTFEMLYKNQIPMQAKPFAVGLRMEHPQDMIGKQQYGEAYYKKLPAAPYKVTANLSNQRGVYSFCMCPGGYVVNASSERGYLAVNGMSYYARDSHNANSAIIVTVGTNDFPSDDALSGIAFQRELEKKAYDYADGAIPQQLYGDFKRNVMSKGYGDFSSVTCGTSLFAPLHRLFSKEMTESFIAGVESFDQKIHGFAREDAILSGVESRTSSPVKIYRNKQFESEIKGLYPCGEGAGYAGGIMSAAMDGLKIAEAIAARFAPLTK